MNKVREISLLAAFALWNSGLSTNIFTYFSENIRDLPDFQPLCVTLTFDLDLDPGQGRVKAESGKIWYAQDGLVSCMYENAIFSHSSRR